MIYKSVQIVLNGHKTTSVIEVHVFLSFVAHYCML